MSSRRLEIWEKALRSRLGVASCAQTPPPGCWEWLFSCASQQKEENKAAPVARCEEENGVASAKLIQSALLSPAAATSQDSTQPGRSSQMDLVDPNKIVVVVDPSLDPATLLSWLEKGLDILGGDSHNPASSSRKKKPKLFQKRKPLPLNQTLTLTSSPDSLNDLRRMIPLLVARRYLSFHTPDFLTTYALAKQPHVQPSSTVSCLGTGAEAGYHTLTGGGLGTSPYNPLGNDYEQRVADFSQGRYHGWTAALGLPPQGQQQQEDSKQHELKSKIAATAKLHCAHEAALDHASATTLSDSTSPLTTGRATQEMEPPLALDGSAGCLPLCSSSPAKDTYTNPDLPSGYRAYSGQRPENNSKQKYSKKQQQSLATTFDVGLGQTKDNTSNSPTNGTHYKKCIEADSMGGSDDTSNDQKEGIKLVSCLPLSTVEKINEQGDADIAGNEIQSETMATVQRPLHPQENCFCELGNRTDSCIGGSSDSGGIIPCSDVDTRANIVDSKVASAEPKSYSAAPKHDTRSYVDCRNMSSSNDDGHGNRKLYRLLNRDAFACQRTGQSARKKEGQLDSHARTRDPEANEELKPQQHESEQLKQNELLPSRPCPPNNNAACAAIVAAAGTAVAQSGTSNCKFRARAYKDLAARIARFPQPLTSATQLNDDCHSLGGGDREGSISGEEEVDEGFVPQKQQKKSPTEVVRGRRVGGKKQAHLLSEKMLLRVDEALRQCTKPLLPPNANAQDTPRDTELVLEGHEESTSLSSTASTERGLSSFTLLPSFAAGPQLAAVQELSGIWGVGETTAWRLVREHKILGVADLRKRKGVNQWLSRSQLIGLNRYEDLLRRMPRAEASKIGEVVRLHAQRILPGCEVVVCGSFRRGKAESGDVDVLIAPPQGYSDFEDCEHLMASASTWQEEELDQVEEEELNEVEADGDDALLDDDSGGGGGGDGGASSSRKRVSRMQRRSSSSQSSSQSARLGQQLLPLLLESLRRAPGCTDKDEGSSGPGCCEASGGGGGECGGGGGGSSGTGGCSSDTGGGGPAVGFLTDDLSLPPLYTPRGSCSSYMGVCRLPRTRPAPPPQKKRRRLPSLSLSSSPPHTCASSSSSSSSSCPPASSSMSSSASSIPPSSPSSSSSSFSSSSSLPSSMPSSLPSSLQGTSSTPPPERGPLPSASPTDLSECWPSSLHRRLDIKTYPRWAFPFALFYFTGSGHFNRSVRLWAKKHGWRLTDKELEPRDWVNPAPLPAHLLASNGSTTGKEGATAALGGEEGGCEISKKRSSSSSSGGGESATGTKRPNGSDGVVVDGCGGGCGSGGAGSGRRGVACLSEEDIFVALGLEWRAPWERNCDDVEDGDAVGAAGGVTCGRVMDGTSEERGGECSRDDAQTGAGKSRQLAADALHRAQKKY